MRSAAHTHTHTQSARSGSEARKWARFRLFSRSAAFRRGRQHAMPEIVGRRIRSTSHSATLCPHFQTALFLTRDGAPARDDRLGGALTDSILIGRAWLEAGEQTNRTAASAQHLRNDREFIGRDAHCSHCAGAIPPNEPSSSLWPVQSLAFLGSHRPSTPL